jgi:DNA polymerase III alpha subunit
VGLSRVFGLAEATGARVLAARAERRFASLADLVDRARPTLPELESLILAGALDWTARTRPSRRLEARVGERLAPAGRARVARSAARAPALAAPDGRILAPEAIARLDVPALPEFGAAERVRGEIQATGLWFSGHPLDALAPDAAAGTTPAADVPRHAGRRVTVLGLPCAYRRVETKGGGLMLFLTLADRTGVVECVLFPDAYERFAAVARGEVLRVAGRVDDTLGAVTLAADHVLALAAGAPAANGANGPGRRQRGAGPAGPRPPPT